jgi:hypothetical protein
MRAEPLEGFMRRMVYLGALLAGAAVAGRPAMAQPFEAPAEEPEQQEGQEGVDTQGDPPSIAVPTPAEPAEAEATRPEERRTLSVVGTGQVDVSPDEAVLILGVSADAPTAKDAYDGAARQMSGVVESLRSRVPERQIQTSGVSLQPRYDARASGAPRLIGYTAGATLTIAVDDLNAAGDVLDAAVTAGANDVRGISYKLRDPTAARKEALDLAVADARGAAEQVAAKLGAQLGPAITVSIRDETGTPPQPLALAARGEADVAAMPVLPGQGTWSSRVEVTYTLLGGEENATSSR